MSWHSVTQGSSLAPGDRRTLRIADKEILVCRVGDEYFAVSNRCTHAAWPLSAEPLDGTAIVCTLHGARFDLRDGCPTAGPASRPLTTYPLEVRDGELYVRL